MNQLGDGLETADYTVDEVTKLRNPDLLMQIKLVLMGVATIVRHCLKLALDKVFNPAEFIGEKWTVWKGPADGDGLNGDEDCVSEPDTVDFEQVVLETHLQEGDKGSVHGEEKMKRVRASKNRQLGGKAFLALWSDWQACKNAGRPEDSVLEKLRKAKKIGNVIYFFGLTLRRPSGGRSVLYLFFSGREWRWCYRWLDSHWRAGSPSVSLASVD
jgi:hypothetical protein